MIKYAERQWNKNYNALFSELSKRYDPDYWETPNYEDLFRLVAEHILGEDWDKEKITVIDDRERSFGSILFIIPRKAAVCYECDYLMTHINCGNSLDGDALVTAHYYATTKDEFVIELMLTCKQMVSNLICPYNSYSGWGNPDFDIV